MTTINLIHEYVILSTLYYTSTLYTHLYVPVVVTGHEKVRLTTTGLKENRTYKPTPPLSFIYRHPSYPELFPAEIGMAASPWSPIQESHVLTF